jgi:hypothetical protein
MVKGVALLQDLLLPDDVDRRAILAKSAACMLGNRLECVVLLVLKA